MVKDNKDIRDPEQALPASYGSSFKSMSLKLPYLKTTKLITALYLVTDIIDKDEPLRNKLRTLGAEILSDTYSNFSILESHINKVSSRIDEILSFLGIAGALSLVSEMNSSILKKEFMELKQSLNSSNASEAVDQTLSELFQEDKIIPTLATQPTRIGVQRGSTLMKALSDRMPSPSLSDRPRFEKPKRQNISNISSQGHEGSNGHKADRREEILKIIKENSNGGGGLTITDIKSKAQGPLASCGEKTLQRELVSMVGEGVLNKTGSKRWSRYLARS